MKKISQVLPNSALSQGGPKTDVGKAISSKNATKDAIFVKGLLPWEDPQHLAQLMQDLQKQWGGHASAKLIMLPIEQAYIELQRLMVAQKNRIEGVMQSLDIARQFASEAGLDLLKASQFPAWYFLQDEDGEKEWALHIDCAQEQALALKANFHDRLVPTIEQQYPDLFQYVMDGYKQNQSFISVLGHRYRQSTPTLNLGVVSNEIGEKYPFHLIWAQAPQRYELIIEGIRAQQMVEAMNLEQYSRYLTRCQNAITKGIQTLAQLKETLRLDEERHTQINASQTVLNIQQADRKVAVVQSANASIFTQTANGAIEM